jgi:hypothetical protein
MVRRCENDAAERVVRYPFQIALGGVFRLRSCCVPGVYGTKAWAYMLVSTAVGLSRNLLSQFGKIILSFRQVLLTCNTALMVLSWVMSI